MLSSEIFNGYCSIYSQYRKTELSKPARMVSPVLKEGCTIILCSLSFFGIDLCLPCEWTPATCVKMFTLSIGAPTMLALKPVQISTVTGLKECYCYYKQETPQNNVCFYYYTNCSNAGKDGTQTQSVEARLWAWHVQAENRNRWLCCSIWREANI